MRRRVQLALALVVGLVIAAAVASGAGALTSSPSKAHAHAFARQVPRPTASARPGGLLFDGDHLRDFAKLEEAPNAITEVPDPLGSGEPVLKMTVDNGDVAPITPTDNPRAQALSPDLIRLGDEFWLSTKFLLPADFPSDIPGWMSLVSIYGPPFDGSSPWQIGLEGDEMSWERNENYDFDEPWKAPMIRGRWVHLLLHERFDHDGWVAMWINGHRIEFFARGASDNRNHNRPTTLLHMATADWSNDQGPNAAKIMQYREEGMFARATVYFGALKIGTTREAVAGG
jgi:hypothetical protein